MAHRQALTVPSLTLIAGIGLTVTLTACASRGVSAAARDQVEEVLSWGACTPTKFDTISAELAGWAREDIHGFADYARAHIDDSRAIVIRSGLGSAKILIPEMLVDAVQVATDDPTHRATLDGVLDESERSYLSRAIEALSTGASRTE